MFSSKKASSSDSKNLIKFVRISDEEEVVSTRFTSPKFSLEGWLSIFKIGVSEKIRGFCSKNPPKSAKELTPIVTRRFGGWLMAGKETSLAFNSPLPKVRYILRSLFS